MAKSIEQGIKDQNKQQVESRTLEKISENVFRLTIENKDEKYKTTKDFNKKELKQIYDELNGNLTNLENARKQETKKAESLTKMPEDEQDRIEDFIYMMNQAKEFQEAQKSKSSIPNINNQIESLNQQKTEIEHKLPEVLRN